jgi:hypothetical protein
MELAATHRFSRVALPLIGAGSGGISETEALRFIERTMVEVASPVHATIVRFRAS